MLKKIRKQVKLILLPDDTFDGTNMKKIELFQQAEEDRALFYSRKNSIPLFIFDNDNRYGELLEFI